MMLSTILFAASVNPVLVASGIAVALGVLLFFWGLKNLRESRTVAGIPEAPVRAIAAGPVHVHGKTAGDGAFMSPVSGAPCYYYKVQVEKWAPQGNQANQANPAQAQGRWEIFKNEAAERTFCVEDGTGRVLVDPHSAEYDLPQTLRAEIGPHSSHYCHIDPSLGLPRLTENQLHAALMADWAQARAAVQELGVPGAKVVDKVLAAGQKMGSMGLSMTVDGVSINPGGIGESYRFQETCLLAGHEYSVIGTCDQNPSAKDERDGKVIRKGTSAPFLISPKTGAQLVKNLRLQGMVMIVIGIAMMAGGVAFAALRLSGR
ncbi:MAG TPA: GIDE domain-containing protein [Candidatus Angelobacter sp.]|nr:GIDE domain-containing protein [Candidatus Angelobacter sp.]